MSTRALQPGQVPAATNDQAGDVARTDATPTVVDEVWLETAYRTHGKAIKTRLAAIVADTPLAEDLTQEVFVVAWRARHRFVGVGDGASEPAAAWLLGIATNLARNARRKRLRAWIRRQRREVLSTRPPSVDAGPEQAVAAQQSAERLLAAMRRLPPEQCEAFGLRVIEGLSLQRCAEVLVLPVSTVSYRARKAEAKLRAVLEEKS